jgi:NADH:ubiquinone reductase (H+-translocating)
MHRVVIVGGGFAGLSAAKAFEGKPFAVTVVDQRNFNTFQPLLYQVATAGLDAGDVAYPIRSIFGHTANVTFRFAKVTGVDWDDRALAIEEADPIPFDSVIVASGAAVGFFGVPGASQFTFPLYTLTDARILRDHVLRRLEQADADPAQATEGPLTFVVVGGGPTGVEVAGALAELLDLAVRHDGFRFARATARIIVVDGIERLLATFAPQAAAYAADFLTSRGIELRLGHMVSSVTDTCVELDDGSTIPTQTVIWAGGITVKDSVASRFADASDDHGRLVVSSDLTLGGRQFAYAVGDAAAVPWGDGSGRTCPQLAQVAIQSGAHAARQVINGKEGRPTTPFRYRDKGIMATLGRRAAITEFPSGRIIRGTLGWFAWLGLHIVYLIGFRNRIIVLVNWAWRYLSWGSGPRVIVGDMLEVRDGGASDAEATDPAR